MSRRLAAGAGAAAVGILTGLIALLSGPGRIVEAQTFDWRVSAAQHGTLRPDVVIVEINESSLRAMAPIAGRWPWPRSLHAGAIDFLARAGAAAIVYDVQFTEPDTQGIYRIGSRILSGADSDAELVAAVRRAGNVVLLADATFEGLEQHGGRPDVDCGVPALPGTIYSPGPGLPARPSICLPFTDLKNAAAAVGHNVLRKDPGGVSRAMLPFIEAQGVAVPSLATASVLLTGRTPPGDVRFEPSAPQLRMGATVVPLRGDGEIVLRFRGPYAPVRAADAAVSVYPFFDVLLSEERVRSGQPPAIPLAAFAGKIVFVGTSATGLADVHATAFGGSTPGVYLHATLADNLINQHFMRRSSASADVLLTALAATIAVTAVLTLPVWWAAGILVILGAAGWLVATQLVHGGLWVTVVGPAAAASASSAVALAWQFFTEGREKRAIKHLFGRYVSPAIFRRLMTNPAAARIGGERRQMSVLFSDIRGFTSASETGAPEAVVAQLNEYLGAMVDVLFRHHGTLDKFVGDQVMGLFGAPVDDPQHADHAVAAALEMSATLDRLNSRWASEGKPGFEIGIGVNTGQMIAGNVGSDAIMSYTVIGDAVNLGARIESLNKDFGTRILISDATRRALATSVRCRLVGEVTVKGRREPVEVHEVMTTPEERT